MLLIDYCYIYYHRRYGQISNKSKILFDGLDKFLLALNDDEQKTLLDLKKELFVTDIYKLHLYVPFDFLQKQIEVKNDSRYLKGWEEKDNLPLWIQMVDDFFTWLSSSNEELKAEFLEEFWNFEEVVEAKKRLTEKNLKTEEVSSKNVNS